MKARLYPLMRQPAIWMPLALALLAMIAATSFMHMVALFGPVSSAQGALVGDALLGSAGKTDAGVVLASYPPVALFPVIALQAVTGLAGYGAANLLSAFLAALLAGMWLRGMMLAGFPPLTSLAMTLLLCLNPLFLYAVAEGPQLMLTLWGAWLFAVSAFAIRSRGGINDLMLCSGSLTLLAFAGQSGILLAIATIPFLLLVMPADIRARSWISVYLVLLFPTLFLLLGFMLVNWMMLHDPLAFVRPQLDAPGEWFAGSWKHTTSQIVAAVASAPILLGLFILARERRPIQAVALALTGAVMLLAVLALQTGVDLSLTAALSPAVALAAAAAMRWPLQDRRAPRAMLLLMLGFMGSGFAILGENYSYTSGSAIQESRRIAGERRLGVFLAGSEAVLIDAAAHPQVVAARGTAEGLVTAGETEFDLSMLRKRVGDDIVAVVTAAPDPSRSADVIGRILPNFHVEGAAGFHLVYDRDGWRVWRRTSRRNSPEDDTP